MLGLCLATLVATSALGPAEQAAVRAQAAADRDELAGWLRGTAACQGGRVARHLADMLRARGLDAEFHPAGAEGGYTVAHSGARRLPVAAVIVAHVTACPGPPDDAELQHGQAARVLWRAAAVSAALTQTARRADASARVIALFLGGDGGGHCGRDFVDNTWPALNAGAPVLDVGGLLDAGAEPPSLLLELAAPRAVSFELRAVGEARDAAGSVDRALALLDSFSQPAPDDARRRLTRELLQQAEASAEPGLAALELDGLQRSRCTLGPRLARDRARVDCRLAPGYPARQLAFDLYQRVKKLPVVLSHERTAATTAEVPSAIVERVGRSAAQVWPGLVVQQGYQPRPPCGELAAIGAPTLGVPLVPLARAPRPAAATPAPGTAPQAAPPHASELEAAALFAADLMASLTGDG